MLGPTKLPTPGEPRGWIMSWQGLGGRIGLARRTCSSSRLHILRCSYVTGCIRHTSFFEMIILYFGLPYSHFSTSAEHLSVVLISKRPFILKPTLHLNHF